MKFKIALALAAFSILAGCGSTPPGADERQATAQKQSLDAADREIGMPRIVNFAQRKMLKNAYEDMDQTTLVYVYTQSLDGKFLCLGQALGYGVMGGTQFTRPETVLNRGDSAGNGPVILSQAEPNGLFTPSSGAATIVNLIDPVSGQARTALMEPNVVTTPNKLHAGVVSVPCPGDVDPSKVIDAREVSVVKQRN
jgi:hypothetical protein